MSDAKLLLVVALISAGKCYSTWWPLVWEEMEWQQSFGITFGSLAYQVVYLIGKDWKMGFSER